MPHTILGRPAVNTRTNSSRSRICRRVSHGTFSKPVSLGARAVGWMEAEIQEWLQRQIETRRKVNALPSIDFVTARHSQHCG
jgi:prophage regulatory protein